MLRRSVPTDGDTYQIGFLRPGPYVVRIAFGDVVARPASSSNRPPEAVSFELGAASADGWTTEPLAPPSDYRTDVIDSKTWKVDESRVCP